MEIKKDSNLNFDFLKVDIGPTFETTGKIIIKEEKDSIFTAILLFKKNESLYLHGAVNFRIAYGCLECFGFLNKPKKDMSFQTLVAPVSVGAFEIKSFPSLENILKKDIQWTQEEIILGIPNLVGDEIESVLVFKSFDLNPYIYNKNEILRNLSFVGNRKKKSQIKWISKNCLKLSTCILYPKGADLINLKLIILSEKWNMIKNDILEFHKTDNQIVLVCGKKNVGKSTFCKYMINSFLSITQKVAFLDCDLSQQELNPPGFISLSILKEPLLGPPFTNIHTSKILYEQKHYLGSYSTTEKLDWMLSCIVNLFSFYSNSSNPLFFGNIEARRIPIIINTHGWIQGKSYETLLTIIKTIKPNQIVQMFESDSDENKIKFQDLNLIDYKPMVYDTLKHFTIGENFYIDSSKRRIQQNLSYFESPKKTYQVPWNVFRIYIINTDVPYSQIMFILNASIVGLVIDEGNYVSIQEKTNSKQNINESLPQFLLERPDPTSSYCIGLGIISSIDMINKLFYIQTNVPFSSLIKVNTLIKSQEEMPIDILISEASINSPYLTTDSIIGEGTGSSNLKIRNNILRKNFN